MNQARSVIVVGGGVIGLSVARYAQREGFDVTVIERGAPGHDSCSLGNAGLVVPSHFVPLAAPGMVGIGLRSMFERASPIHVPLRFDPRFIRWGLAFMRSATAAHVRRSAPALRDLSLLSRRCYEELAAERGNDFGLVREGLLAVCRTQHALEDEVRMAALANELGIEARVLTGTELAQIEPRLALDVAGGVHFPLDCHLTPQRFVAGLTRELTAGGARFLWQTEVTGWRVEAGRVVAAATAAGEIAADEYVLAAGAWSPRTTRGLGLRLPVEAGKGYSLTLPAPRVLPRCSALLVEARVAVTPMQDGLRFAGTMELSGLDQSIDPVRVRAIAAAVPRYYPEFSVADFDGIEPWLGLRPCSPDGLPYLGRSPRHANLCIATGHAMMGLSLGPASGRVIADLLAGRTPSVPLEPFAPGRFG